MERIEAGKAGAKEAIGELLDTLKQDYANLSPTSALILFVLGAAFGHALASKERGEKMSEDFNAV